jgi:hypothetical protein
MQGVSPLLPASAALNQNGRGGNGVRQSGSGRIGRVIAKAVFFTDAEGLGLNGCEVGLDPLQRDLAEEKPPKVPIFALEQSSGADVTDAAGQAKGQILGIDHRNGVTGAARHPDDS